MSKSEFKFTPHKVADDERRPYGLVDVYDRATGAHLGMLNPGTDGTYVLRNREGDRLGANNAGDRLGANNAYWIEDVIYGLSRDTCAGILRDRIAQYDAMMARRVGSVSEGCPNNWHNTAVVRSSIACPECPTQPGLKLALAVVQGLINVRLAGGDDAGALQDALDEIQALVHTPAN